MNERPSVPSPSDILTDGQHCVNTYLPSTPAWHPATAPTFRSDPDPAPTFISDPDPAATFLSDPDPAPN